MGIPTSQQGTLSASRPVAWGGVFPKILHGKNVQTIRKRVLGKRAERRVISSTSPDLGNANVGMRYATFFRNTVDPRR